MITDIAASNDAFAIHFPIIAGKTVLRVKNNGVS